MSREELNVFTGDGRDFGEDRTMRGYILKRLCLPASLLAVGAVLLYAQTTSTYPTEGKVVRDAVNLRHGAGTDTSRLLIAFKGDRLKILGQKADWYEVELPGDLPLWVHKDYVVRGTGGAGVIRGASVHVRHGAGTEFKAMGLVHTGRKIRIMGEQGDWLKFTYLSADHGYVNIRYVVLTGQTEPRRPVVVDVHQKPPVIGDEETSVLVLFKKAETLYETEVNKPKFEDWDLAEAEKLYRQIQPRATDGFIKTTVSSRLAYIDLVKQCHSSMVTPEEYRRKLQKLEAEINEEFSKRRQSILAGETRPTYLATGRIEKLVSTWLKPATHKLMDGGKIVYLLYSDKERLSIYEGRFVGLLGEFDRTLRYDRSTVRVGDVDVLERKPETQEKDKEKETDDKKK